MDRESSIIGVDIPAHLAAIPILRDNGFTFNEIADSQGISRRQVYNRLQKLPKELDLTSKKRIKVTLKAHDAIVNTVINPNADPALTAKTRIADVNTAINRVLDRHQPIKRDDDHGSQVSYTQVNINVFACD